jgi:hypothetical protein
MRERESPARQGANDRWDDWLLFYCFLFLCACYTLAHSLRLLLRFTFWLLLEWAILKKIGKKKIAWIVVDKLSYGGWTYKFGHISW